MINLCMCLVNESLSNKPIGNIIAVVTSKQGAIIEREKIVKFYEEKFREQKCI